LGAANQQRQQPNRFRRIAHKPAKIRMSQYYKITRRLGTPHRNSVTVTIPLVGPQGPAGPQGPQGLPGEVSGTIVWDNVTDKPATFPPSSHTHVAADVTDFATAVAAVSPPVDWNSLTGKPATFAPSTHTHVASDVTDFSTAAAAAAPVQSVAGKTGTVTLAKADVGLSNVDNTADLSKPISTATQTALDGKAATSHTHPSTAITDFNTAAAAAAPVQSVAGRTGAVTLAVADVANAVSDTDARLTDARTPASHTHGNLTNDGKVGTTANLPLKTGTNGVIEAGSFGTAAGSFCEGNDARLSDARTPTSHASSHASGKYAFYENTPSGVTNLVRIVADNIGTSGNGISLSFDGVDDINAVLSAWNAANPTNTATLKNGLGSEIPDNGEIVALSEGVNAGADPIYDQSLNTDDNVEFANMRIGTMVVSGETGMQNLLRIHSTAGSSANNAYLKFTNYDTGTEEFSDGILMGLDTDESAVFWNYEDAPFRIGTNGTERLRVTGAGDCGVGTEDPQAKLDVAGNMALRDTDNEFAATFDVQSQLSDDVTLTIPDQSGTLAVVTDIPTELTDLAATGIAAGKVLAADGDDGAEWIDAPSGGSGEVRSDFVSPYTYTGLADAGTSESTASWTIRRSEFDAGGSFVATLTASAVQWANRLTASYA
jgi:hypothetical protein